MQNSTDSSSFGTGAYSTGSIVDQTGAGRALDQIMASAITKYDSIYYCDIANDTYQQLKENELRRETITISRSGPLSRTIPLYAATGVDREFRDIFSGFMDSGHIRETLVDGQNSFEFQYKESESEYSRWKLGEIIASTRDSDGLVSSYCLLITDINDLKKREFDRLRKLQAQTALLDVALENSGIYDFTYLIPEKRLICSKRTCKGLGCREAYENMPDSFCEEFVHPDFKGVFLDLYGRCTQGEDGASVEFRHRGTGRWLRMMLRIASTDEQGAPTLAVGIMENIDELKEARDEADTMQELCQFAVENHYEGMILIDAKKDTFTTVDIGNDFNDRWGHAGSENGYDATIECIRDTIAADDESYEALSVLFLETLVPALEKTGRNSVRYRAKTDRGERWKLVDTTFFKHDSAKLIMLISDIEEEEHSKKMLEEAMEAADEANRAKSAFLANMSHEIRTPMNTIIGISEILMNRRLPNDVLNEISTIQNAGSGLLAIINDILDFSKIESGKFEITPVDYMLPSLLMDINNMISVRLADKPVNFLMNVQHELPNHLIGDDIRIEQILMNLLGNSVKFTREGFISLRVLGEQIDGSTWKLVFKVVDSGTGIKEEDIGKLFGTFSQVDTTRNRAVTGSGLGLAISKSFAEMMDGTISVESVYGKGSTFTVEILQQVKYYEPIGAVQRKDAKILICENDEVIISSISRTLEDLGIEFRVCRELDKVRSYKNMTHVMIRRQRFLQIKDKLDFMFDSANIYLVLENGEQSSADFMEYKQLQLPLLSLQLINALNGETITTSLKRKNFDRSQIVPLTFAHILIVDDNVTNLQVARGLMAPYKMQVDAATSGFKAIEMVKNIKYDLIFMDHMMPEMDGIEATQHIRDMKDEYYTNIPIIALTANAMSNAKELFLSNGFDDFLAKPIEMTELHRILKQYVQSKAPAGYMEKALAETNAETTDAQPGLIDTAPQTLQPSGSTAASLPFGVPTFANAPSASGGGAMGQLLAQNNTLLQQNMMLLQGLLGGAVGTPVPTGTRTHDAGNPAQGTVSIPKVSSVPKTENSIYGPDVGDTQTLPGSIPEVNMGKALDTYGGSVKMYHTILSTYHNDISEREPTLRKFFDSHDIDNLTIYVHAIKSASREIGADALGELAFQLEKEGKANNWTFIEEHFDTFMTELDTMRRNIGTYIHEYIDTADDAQKEARDRIPADAKEELLHACDEMDYGFVEEKLEELDEYTYPEATQEVLKMLLGYCSEFEYDKLAQLIPTL